MRSVRWRDVFSPVEEYHQYVAAYYEYGEGNLKYEGGISSVQLMKVIRLYWILSTELMVSL